MQFELTLDHRHLFIRNGHIQKIFDKNIRVKRSRHEYNLKYKSCNIKTIQKR
jgi:hypothetical protein